MEKTKPLLPSLREKKRYVTFEILSRKHVGDGNQVSKDMIVSINNYLGTAGMSRAGVQFLAHEYNAENQRGIIRVSNKAVDSIKASFLFITDIAGQDVITRSVGVSGMVKKAKEMI